MDCYLCFIFHCRKYARTQVFTDRILAYFMHCPLPEIAITPSVPNSIFLEVLCGHFLVASFLPRKFFCYYSFFWSVFQLMFSIFHFLNCKYIKLFFDMTELSFCTVLTNISRMLLHVIS